MGNDSATFLLFRQNKSSRLQTETKQFKERTDLFVYLFNYFIESVPFFLLLRGYSEVVRSGSSARRDLDPVDLANHADETLLSSRSPSASVKSHLGAE